METRIAHCLARLARERLGMEGVEGSRDSLHSELSGLVEESVLTGWLERVDPTELARSSAPVESVRDLMEPDDRARDGVYFTPAPIADAMAAAVDIRRGRIVVDPAAGDGSLLAAVARRHPSARLIGIEKHPHLAIAAAIRIAAIRREQTHDTPPDDRVFVGDGLARDERWAALEGGAAAVVANPPYVREKGRSELFRRLERKHPHLSEWFGPRIDLQYLFFHRGASLLADGGRLVLLTSAYWLTATGATNVRRDLAERTCAEAFVRLEETGVFADAPGQHTLLSLLRRGEMTREARSVSLRQAPDDWTALVEDLLSEKTDRAIAETPQSAFGEGNWTPFVDRTTRSWGDAWGEEGTRLDQLVDDRQGFVSGADRFHGRHRAHYPEGADLPESGAPIFLFERDEVPAPLAGLGATVLRPLLRASELEPNAVIVEPPAQTRALYVDGEVGAEHEALLEEHLARFRPVLERRREVKSGSMPWYRLHWPRDRTEQTGPKLVVPRRAPEPCFSLDLSASCVSSDCTYLVAPDDVERPLAYLVTLMVALNSAEVGRYLREFGKSKGRQLEFYSEPLRTLPVPLRREGRGLVFASSALGEARRDELQSRVDEITSSIAVD